VYQIVLVAVELINAARINVPTVYEIFIPC